MAETSGVRLATAHAVPSEANAALPVASAVAMPMQHTVASAVAVPMQQSAAVTVAGIADEDISPLELWRTHKCFHPDKGVMIYWLLLVGNVVAIAGIIECVQFFTPEGGFGEIFSPDETFNATRTEATFAASPTFISMRIAEVFIFGDCIKSFMTAYRLEDGSERARRQPACRYEARGRLETRSSMIKRRYLTSWFAVDLLILVSGGVAIMEAIGQDAMGPMKMLRVLRAIRIIKAAQDLQVGYLVWSAIFCPQKVPRNMA